MTDLSADPQARSLVTPEGVDLRVRLATFGERALALMIDGGIMLATLLVLLFSVLAVVSSLHLTLKGDASGQIVAIVWLLGFFLLRNFYFTLMEMTPRAATVGKRIMGLRVAARSGGALSADAVVSRNAMRELELYLPITFMLSRSNEVGSWIILMGVVWCGVFVLFPLFNRDRLRIGDVIAGTWVIKTPRQKLLPDLVSEQKRDARFAFTEAQLSVYGVKELQVLETVLRTAEGEVMAAVADRIRGKIGWKRGVEEANFEFLSAFYAQLRQRLEQRLLFGVRKKDKFDRR